MKWILAILCGLALQAGAYDGVYATKSPYVVEATTMEWGSYLKSLVWVTAEAPKQNSGTNTLWTDFSKTSSGDFKQTILASQPATITTNGAQALYFDGNDSILSVSNFPSIGTNTFTIIGKVSKGAGTVLATFQVVYPPMFLIMNAGKLELGFSGMVNGTSTVSSNLVPATDFKFKVTRNGTNIVWEINDAPVASTGTITGSSVTDSGTPLRIGAYPNGAGYFTGRIYYIQFTKGTP